MKVQLTRELRQEFIRHRQAEQAKAREIATLKRVEFFDGRKFKLFGFFFVDTNAKR
jgi:hypothetical protein